MRTGIVVKLLDDIYKFKKIEGDFAETKKKIIRIRLSLATGLSMNKFTVTSPDTAEEVNKIINVLKQPEFGLDSFPFTRYTT
jgi:hypothetical protein